MEKPHLFGVCKRLTAGKKPAFVHHCQANVMSFGLVEELVKKVTEKFHLVSFAPK